MNIEGIKILILDRGRVKVGRLSKHPELIFHWRLENSRTIRRWGSTEGIEQIALEGPTRETILDRACNSTIPFRAVIEILDTMEEKWEAHLALPNRHSSQNVPNRKR